jgi:rare lipoprotein A
MRLNWKRAGARCALALSVIGGALAAFAAAAEAKAPGKRHCYKGVCHRVMTLPETRAALGKMKKLVASHYDHCRKDRFNPCGLTSSGARFEASRPDNTASAIHPDGTILVVRNPQNGEAAVVRVNNFGPFRGNRKLDVSRATAERLGFARRGVAPLEVLVVHAPTPEETRYKRNRRYDPVPGPLGRLASIESAFMRYADITASQRLAVAEASACRMNGRKRPPALALVPGVLRLAALAR